MIFFDRAHGRLKERTALVAAVKKYLATHLQGVPYEISMHQSASHHYLQIVDYLSWAVFKKWERGDIWPHEVVRHLIKSEFPIFRYGAIKWY